MWQNRKVNSKFTVRIAVYTMRSPFYIGRMQSYKIYHLWKGLNQVDKKWHKIRHKKGNWHCDMVIFHLIIFVLSVSLSDHMITSQSLWYFNPIRATVVQIFSLFVCFYEKKISYTNKFTCTEIYLILFVDNKGENLQGIETVLMDMFYQIIKFLTWFILLAKTTV